MAWAASDMRPLQRWGFDTVPEAIAEVERQARPPGHLREALSVWIGEPAPQRKDTPAEKWLIDLAEEWGIEATTYCQATSVLWPDEEAIDVSCCRALDHGDKHIDDSFGEWETQP